MEGLPSSFATTVSLPVPEGPETTNKYFSPFMQNPPNTYYTGGYTVGLSCSFSKRPKTSSGSKAESTTWSESVMITARVRRP